MKSIATILAVGYNQPPPGYYPPPMEPAYAPPPPQQYYPQPYAPAPAYPPRRPMKPIGPYLGPMVLAIVGMVLLIIALSTPWYGITSTTKSDYDGDTSTSTTNVDVSFGGMEAHSKGSTDSITWSEYKDLYGGRSNLPNLYTGIQALIIIAMIMMILALVAVILHWAGYVPGLANRTSIFLVVGLILGIVAIVLFAGAHAPAYKADIKDTSGKGPWDSFIGSDTHKDESEYYSYSTSTSWQPSFGWILVIVFVVIAGIAIGLMRRLPPVQSRAPMGYGAAYPPAGPSYGPPPEPPAYNPPPGYNQPPPPY